MDTVSVAAQRFPGHVSPEPQPPIALVGTVSGPPDAAARSLHQVAPELSGVEVRADLTGDINPRPLLGHTPGGLLYTLRSTAAGGCCADPVDRRRQRLLAAADHYPLVDLEVDRDLDPRVLERIPAQRRVLSWHGPATDLVGLRRTFDRLAAIPARLYRLTPAATTLAQALTAPLLLKALTRRDVVAYAHGPVGTWTRVLSARFGAPMLFGWVDGGAPSAAAHGRAAGELPLAQLLTHYPRDLLPRANRLYGMIGGATSSSVAPAVNNLGYQSLGLPALFLAFNTAELRSSFGELCAGLDQLGLPLAGATVVTPHKDTALALATEATPLARRAGAANILRRSGAGWQADNEAGAVVTTLTEHGVAVAGCRIAVIGCGGAGRAAAAGLSQAGAEVTLVNRSRGRGLRAARLLQLPFVPLPEFTAGSYAVLIHATLIKEEMPFSLAGADPNAVVFDLTYGEVESPLMVAAREGGHHTLDGRDMVQVELRRQFHLMTNHRLSRRLARDAVGSSRPHPRGSGRPAGTRH